MTNIMEKISPTAWNIAEMALSVSLSLVILSLALNVVAYAVSRIVISLSVIIGHLKWWKR